MYRVIACGNDYKMMKVIIKQLNNLKNSINDAEIEAVFNRSAVKALLKNNENIPEIKKLIDRGVKINACRNTLQELGIDEKNVDTDTGIGLVQAAVEEIVKKQADGYIYLQL